MTRPQEHPIRVPMSQLPMSHFNLVKYARQRSREMTPHNPTYGHSRIDANYVGFLGEVATHGWFEAAGHTVDPLYLQADADTDLTVAPWRMNVEVKTNRLDGWRTYAGSLAMSQVDHIVRGDALVWCVTGPELPTTAVYLMGWVPAPDLVERLEPRVGPKNQLLLRLSHLDDLSTLLPWAYDHTERFTWVRTPASYECRRRHVGLLSVCLDCWWQQCGGPPHLVRDTWTHHVEGCSSALRRAPTVLAADVLTSTKPCKDCMPAVLAGVAVRARAALVTDRVGRRTTGE